MDVPSGSVEWDHQLNAPYMTIPSHPDLRLTPTRKGDEADLARLFNIHEIGRWSYSRPYPYPAEDAIALVQHNLDEAQETIDTLKAQRLSQSGSLTPIETSRYGSPFISIRDTTGRVIGTVSLTPFEHDPRCLTASQMLALPPKEQMWLLGYLLDPQYHRRGIMSTVVRSVLDVWVRQWMRIGKVCAGVGLDNIGSVGLMEKLGFERKMVIEIPWPDGGKRTIGHYVLDVSS